MRILNIVPIISDIWTKETDEYVSKYLLPDTEIVTRKLSYGPASIESEYDEMLASPEVVFMCRQAQTEGFDAVFVNCFGEPGVRAARECVDIPVFGGFEPAVNYALGISEKVGIVTVLPEVVSMIEGLIAVKGLKERIKSLRYVNIPVLDLGDISDLIKALIAESKKAITEDGVGVIVLGCTAMVDVTDSVEKGLKAEGYDIKVIEAAQAALIMLETYVRMGWRQSRLTYMSPPNKQRVWPSGTNITEI